MMTMTPTNTSHKPLIAGVLRRDLANHPGTCAERGFSPAERSGVRAAFGERRDVRERTLDHVVDRLLKELTW